LAKSTPRKTARLQGSSPVCWHEEITEWSTDRRFRNASRGRRRTSATLA
jgi:hypothetical protein